jgi:hypothetical protein
MLTARQTSPFHRTTRAVEELCVKMERTFDFTVKSQFAMAPGCVGAKQASFSGR